MSITVTSVLTSDNTDVLSGTQLDQVPQGGLFAVILASTQNDTEVTIQLGADTLVNARPVPLRANGVPDASNDPSYLVPSPGGVRPVINVNITTSAIVYCIVAFE